MHTTLRSTRSETHVELEAEVSTSIGTHMEIGASDRMVRLRDEGTDFPRYHVDVPQDQDSMVGPRGNTPRRAVTSEHGAHPRSAEASSFELPQVKAAGAGEAPTEGRLHMSMTEEGPSGEYWMTMKRDRLGRWIPTNGARTANIKKARKERKKIYLEESKDQGTFSITSAEASPLRGEFHLSQRNAEEVSWNHLSVEEQFLKAVETEWQRVLDLKAVKIIDPTQACVIREKQCDRVVSSRLVLRWKETDAGYKAKARWCVHGFRDPVIHEIDCGCPTPELSPINITLRIFASTLSEGTLADGDTAFRQDELSVRNEPLYATPPSEGLQGVPEGALIRLDREVYVLVSGMSKW